MSVEAHANPAVLVWARRMTGLELGEAAQKVGTPSHRLASWEKGERHPTLTQLRKMADVYKRPLAVFFLEAPPPDDVAPRDFRRVDPGAAEPLSPALRLAIREARARREAALELLEELEETPPAFGFRANLSDDPEAVGARLREALIADGLPTGGRYTHFNAWRNAVEKTGVLVFQAEDVDVEEMRGLSISERPLPVIVLNIKDAPPARCFSLLHEISHVMLNQGGLCNFEEEGPQTEFRRMEVFCNHVAGAALLPASRLLKEPEVPVRPVSEIPDRAIEALAKRYGASREAVLRRLVILNRVSTAYYQRKRADYARARARRGTTAAESGFAPPYAMAVATSGLLFTRLVLSAYDDERITASDVADYLRVRLKHLDRIRAAVRHSAATGEPS